MDKKHKKTEYLVWYANGNSVITPDWQLVVFCMDAGLKYNNPVTKIEKVK